VASGFRSSGRCPYNQHTVRAWHLPIAKSRQCRGSTTKEGHISASVSMRRIPRAPPTRGDRETGSVMRRRTMPDPPSSSMAGVRPSTTPYHQPARVRATRSIWSNRAACWRTSEVSRAQEVLKPRVCARALEDEGSEVGLITDRAPAPLRRAPPASSSHGGPRKQELPSGGPPPRGGGARHQYRTR
jgi:hypothetical protein